MKHITRISSMTFVALALSFTEAALAVTVSVPGWSNPYLAGMPDGSVAPPDRAPDQSPVEVKGLNLQAGGALEFTGASGGVSNTPTCDQANCTSIDGNVYNGSLFYDHGDGSQNGISDIRAPINSLLGVFLTDNAPNLSPAPAKLNFETIGLNFTSLAPDLQQVFFIGDGKTSSGDVQQFLIPPHATRLFLGTMDGGEWSNNSGAITVNVAVIPEPEIYSMFFAGLGLTFLAARRRIFGSRANLQ